MEQLISTSFFFAAISCSSFVDDILPVSEIKARGKINIC